MAKKKYSYGEKAAAVMELLNSTRLGNKEIADLVGCNANYVYMLRRKMPHRDDTLDLTPDMEVHAATPEPEVDRVDEIIDDRGNQYGTFMFGANVAIRLKGTMHNAIMQQNLGLAPDQLLALDMIAVKISRILSGNPAHVDSWLDIAGYAKLVADRLQGNAR